MSNSILERPAITGLESAKSNRLADSPWLPIACGLIVASFVYGAVLFHYLAPPSGYFFSGAVQDDQQYYMVLSRAIFSNGNGLVYGNPFYQEPCTFHYYSHLFILVVGWVNALTSIDIDRVFQGLGFVFCVAMYPALYFLIKAVEQDRTTRIWMLLLAGFGGGLAWVPGLIDTARSAMHGVHPTVQQFTQSTLSHLYMNGWWLDSVMTTSIYPTECFYHCLMFLTLGCLALNRPILSGIGIALVWWSHGIYGLEISVISCIYLALLIVARHLHVIDNKDNPETEKSIVRYLPVLAAVAAGAFYYLVFLPSIPEHSDIVTNWRSCLYKILTPFYPTHYHFFLLAPLAAGALFINKSCRKFMLQDRSFLLLIAFTSGVFLMMNHNWFITSTQPAHFSRGYLFVALVLLACKSVHALLASGTATSGVQSYLQEFAQFVRRNRKPLSVALALCIPLLAVDNAIVILEHSYNPRFPVAWLPNNYTAMAEYLQKDKTNPLIVGSWENSAFGELYLMRHCNVRAVCAHTAGPWFDQRRTASQNFIKGKLPHFYDGTAKYILANSDEAKTVLAAYPDLHTTCVVDGPEMKLLRIDDAVASAKRDK